MKKRQFNNWEMNIILNPRYKIREVCACCHVTNMTVINIRKAHGIKSFYRNRYTEEEQKWISENSITKIMQRFDISRNAARVAQKRAIERGNNASNQILQD